MYPYPTKKYRSAFTLIELLVVIAIIAILSVVVILTLNPADLFRQSRDATRLADFSTLSNALNYYSVSTEGSLGIANKLYISIPDPLASSTLGDQYQGLGLPALPVGWTYQCASLSTYKKVDGTGWIPVNFTTNSMQPPLSTLPVDPINQTSSGFYYSYATDAKTYELNGIYESQKTKQGQINWNVTQYPEAGITGSNSALSLLFNTSGLVRYWTFDEGAGTIIHDYSTNGDIGSGPLSFIPSTPPFYALGLIPMALAGSVSAPSWSLPGKIGVAAMYFPTNAMVSFSSIASLPQTQMTASAWVNVQTFAINAAYISSNGSGPGTWMLSSDASGNAIFEIQNGSSLYVPASGCAAAFKPSAWHLLTGTYDGTNLFVYLDGVQCGTNTLSSQTLNSSAFLVAKSLNSVFTEDDVRVYNRILSPAEVMALYNAQK
jgi:prepilin-type N-terminal cleavage/methylation domain-containing protein